MKIDADVDLESINQKTSVVGRGNSIYEVVVSIITVASFVAQIAGVVAIVLGTIPFFFLSWGNGDAIKASIAVMVFAFLITFAIAAYFGVSILGRIPQPRSENGQFAGKLKPTFVNVDGTKTLYYEYRGVKIAAEKLDKLIE